MIGASIGLWFASTSGACDGFGGGGFEYGCRCGCGRAGWR